jgi:hypothetical protein
MQRGIHPIHVSVCVFHSGGQGLGSSASMPALPGAQPASRSLTLDAEAEAAAGAGADPKGVCACF